MITENRFWRGFTLIEMVMVLFVVSVIALIPSLKLPDMERQLDNQFFFEEFERLITITQESAVFSGRASRIIMKRNERSVAFDYVLSNGVKTHYYVEIPEDIRAETDTFVTFLGETGTLSKVTKFKFLLTKSQKKVVYQFYLGSGKYAKKESEV